MGATSDDGTPTWMVTSGAGGHGTLLIEDSETGEKTTEVTVELALALAPMDDIDEEPAVVRIVMSPATALAIEAALHAHRIAAISRTN